MTNIRLISNSLVLLLISFVLISCSSVSITADNSEEIKSNSQFPNANHNSQEIKSESRFPIIEIWQELDGSVPIRGKSLYFRMYDNGIIEFEYVLKRKDESGKPRSIYSIERTSPTKISEEEFSRIKLLLEELTKSKEIKQEYKSVGLIFDVTVKLMIFLKENDTTEKKMVINNSDLDVMDGRFEKNFPKSLVNLVKEVHLMRNKLREKIE
jgi:hypothetical protein